MSGILVPIAFFAMIAVILVGPRYLKSQERQKMADTLRAAIERGQPLPPEVIDALSSNVKAAPSPRRDLRTGIIMLFIAGGLAAMGVLIGFQEPDATFPMIAVAAIPGFIGLAYLVIALALKDRK